MRYAAGRVATHLTIVGVSLMLITFYLGAYRSELHMVSIVVLIVATLLWTLILLATRRQRFNTTRRAR